MTAHIIEFSEIRARVLGRRGQIARGQAAEAAAPRFHFWSGASSKRYVHTIHNLADCPPLPPGNFILVRREENGRRTALSIGRVTHPMPMVNLAEIRYRGESLGAHEVHVHLLAASVNESKRVEFDLRTGQMNSGASEASAPGDGPVEDSAAV